MLKSSKLVRAAGLALGIGLTCTGMSCSYRFVGIESDFGAAPPNPLGYAADPIWQLQEINGEASDFVIYDHEFVGDTTRLNTAGEDHVKQIAVRVQETPFPVVVERSMSSIRETDVYKFPVHPNPALDNRRREVVVQLLVAMGVPDADQRTVVAPAIAEGLDSIEAERAYYRALNAQGLRNGWGNAWGGGWGLGGGY